ncbi:MAG: 2-oxo acid dehydrogenase subunit E2 [Treponema sp.]|jgi:pyruvate dehydrogenase E2 component (dihydrolipoamide acetyltransferase)|nr:2-oxo acid dehydrogenase subunit E2 [Treponema sp.]
MANSIIMPKTGMAMEEGQIVEWKVKQGDKVRKGDVVAVIETDKSTMELESDYDGMILALLYNAGDTVPVTRVIAWIGGEGEAVPQDGGAASVSAGRAVSGQVSPGQAGPSAAPAAVSAFAPAGGPRPRATPAARALAKEKGVALASIAPGGKSGEITRADVDAAVSAAETSATPLARRIAEAEGVALAGIRGSGHGGKIFSADLPRLAGPRPAAVDTRVALTNIQKITGKRMLESRQTIPEVTEHTGADVTRMLEIRKELNDGFSSAGLPSKITVNDFVLAAVVKALVSHPRMNSVFAGNEIVYKGSVNLGVAVATERGLLVPVIRDAQYMGLREISAAAAELVAKARGGKLSSDLMEGGTFTVSNVGMYGITAFTPIINPPEAGILGVCAIEDQLKLEGGAVVNRKKMGLSLAFDHRIVDGADSAVFLKNVKDLLESPLLLMA